MSSGPLPSDRCLLSSLCKKQIGSKVRFLGCITEYSTHSAQITLKHRYPKEDGDVEALVDVKLVLETLNAEHTDMGQWVHVIGYITFVHPALPVAAVGSRNPPRSRTAVPARVGVQALMLWIARDLDLGVYEKSMLADDASQNTMSLAPKNPKNLVVR
ncbi:CST complex subunit Ten1 [Nemania sp. FL0031]|nr:CST complex subunit Ten1 [Nemania sp. FL0031]